MIFEVRNGTFAYPNGKTVLENINFRFGCQGIMSVLGRNGAGKTTLLRCMLGLQKWTFGETLINNINAEQLSYGKFWGSIGYVPQAKMPSFIYSVLDLVLLGRSAHLSLFARPGKKDRKIALEALENVGIAHLADKMCNQISGGEFQLALVARALAAKPKLLILDEPESNLDFKNQLRVLQVLKELSTVSGIGAIINTHFPAHALEISDSSLLLLPGRRSTYGLTKDVLTEANLSESFGVPVSIIPVDIEGRPNFACVAAKNTR